MLERPDISDAIISARVLDAYGLQIEQVTFLPVGWVNNAAYRLAAGDGAAYFLKLRRGQFSDVAVAVPAFLQAQGVRQVMAPVATTTGELWVHALGFDWILYPFFAGTSGFEVDLSPAQWIALGEAMRAVHAVRLPAALAARVPQEGYSPHWRSSMRAFLALVERESYSDPIAARMAAFLRAKHDEIAAMIARAEQLAGVLRQRVDPFAVCHADLHAGNVLVGSDERVAIVDWDDPILAPKERDLMFIGGGVGGTWNDDQTPQWFYRGYGSAGIDLVALSYYRYERIVVDITEYSEQIFGLHGSVEERQQSLEVVSQFLPNNVVDIAHRTYAQLRHGATHDNG
jgi:spectinomycin phosphotransferase